MQFGGCGGCRSYFLFDYLFARVHYSSYSHFSYFQLFVASPVMGKRWTIVCGQGPGLRKREDITRLCGSTGILDKQGCKHKRAGGTLGTAPAQAGGRKRGGGIFYEIYQIQIAIAYFALFVYNYKRRGKDPLRTLRAHVRSMCVLTSSSFPLRSRSALQN